MSISLRAAAKFLRALVTADDVKHWIDKYEAAKRDNQELRAEVQRLRERLDVKRETNERR